MKGLVLKINHCAARSVHSCVFVWGKDWFPVFDNAAPNTGQRHFGTLKLTAHPLKVSA